MKKLSKKKLCELLKTIKSATICTITTKTEVKLRKQDDEGNENNFGPSVTKVSTINGLFCSDYESAVNKQRGKEGLKKNFEAKSRAWGVRIGNSPLIEHNGNFYVEIRVLNSSQAYEFNEVPLTEEETSTVENFLPSLRPSRQGVDNEVVVRTYNLDNVKEVRCQGAHYVIS